MNIVEEKEKLMETIERAYMLAIYIAKEEQKTKEKPESCCACEFIKNNATENCCILEYEKTIEYDYDKRPEWCPLDNG